MLKNIAHLFFYLLCIFLALPPAAMAACTSSPGQIAPVCDLNASSNPVNKTDPTTTINSIYTVVLDLLTRVAAVAAIFYLIWAGIRYIVSAGNPEKAKQARTSIVNAVIGIIIITCAYTIIFLAHSVATFINTNTKA